MPRNSEMGSSGMHPKMGGREAEGQHEGRGRVSAVWDALCNQVSKSDLLRGHPRLGRPPDSKVLPRDHGLRLRRLDLLDVRDVRRRHPHDGRRPRAEPDLDGARRPAALARFLTPGSCRPHHRTDDPLGRSGKFVMLSFVFPSFTTFLFRP